MDGADRAEDLNPTTPQSRIYNAIWIEVDGCLDIMVWIQKYILLKEPITILTDQYIPSLFLVRRIMMMEVVN